MSTPASDNKRRPPPIAILEWPPSWSAPGRETSTYTQRFASTSTQHAACSSTATPLTSPVDPDDVRVAIPKPGSQASRHCSSAIPSLSGLIDHARSPRKSDSSSLPSRRGSTARSRQSERSHRSAAAAQTQLEALDEDETTRSQIESRTERKLFKMTGQIPPTPESGPINPERIFIRTEDLRAQCRAASGEKQPEADEPAKSPKKRLFGVNLPTFGRTAATAATPAMPSKAAQILGTTPSRKPHQIEPRPIKSSVLKTPTKAPRSDAARSLPAKVYEIHYSTSNRRRRTTGRRSPGKGLSPPHKQGAALSSLESMPPPTPPAKDTPPELRPPKNPASPLRRAPSREDLRQSYGHLDRGAQVQLQFPIFALSPSPAKTAIPSKGGISPTKFRPYTAEDYTKLIEGEAMHWPYPEDAGHQVKEGGRSAPLTVEHCGLLQLPLSSRSEDSHYNERLGRRLSPLPPRFYSPSDRSIRLFNDDESPSHNTDTSRLLFAPYSPSKSSHNALTEMDHQRSINAIEIHAPESQMIENDDAQTHGTSQKRNDVDIAAKVEEKLQLEEKDKLRVSTNDTLEADSSSSTLMGMLNSAPPRTVSKENFLHPSAVPTPLHKPHGPYLPMPPAPMLRGGHGTVPGLWPAPRPHKTIEDHFLMTNEHLDVVGKTTYDALDMYTKQQISAANANHGQLLTMLDDHIKGLKAQISSVNEKAEDTSKQAHNVGLKIDHLEQFLKDEVLSAMSEQTKKTIEMYSSIGELQSTIMRMQQAIEKLCATESGPYVSASSTLPASSGSTVLPHTAPNHHSQPALTSYLGGETRRDEQLAMPPLQDRTHSNNYDSHGDPRTTYGANWQAQGWNGRPSYHSRNKGEGSSYAGPHPYQFGNGGQYNAGYVNGYSSYDFSPIGSEQPYTYGQKPAQ